MKKEKIFYLVFFILILYFASSNEIIANRIINPTNYSGAGQVILVNISLYNPNNFYYIIDECVPNNLTIVNITNSLGLTNYYTPSFCPFNPSLARITWNITNRSGSFSYRIIIPNNYSSSYSLTGIVYYGNGLQKAIGGNSLLTKIECNNICNEGTRRCLSSTTYQICGDYDKDGCFEWNYGINCSVGEICLNGTCIKQNLIPLTPTNLQGVAVSPNQINLSWKDNSNNEQGFIIERGIKVGKGINSFLNWSIIHKTNENVNMYTDVGLTPQEEYYYRVYAFNNFGNSNYSETINVEIPPCRWWQRVRGIKC
ncbi:MAG: fibronectin type III domain-containing protein [Candidatus Pacearchaeota archaeon]